MPNALRCFAVLTCLLSACGCGGPPDAPSDASPTALHRRALERFSRGHYAACVSDLQAWLRGHGFDYPVLAASARFYVALSYREMGNRERARAVFEDICTRYAGLPAEAPQARWRDWAKKELAELEK